jgi:hypothetical protein
VLGFFAIMVLLAGLVQDFDTALRGAKQDQKEDRQVGSSIIRELGEDQNNTQELYSYDNQKLIGMILGGIWGFIFLVMITLLINVKTGCLTCDCCRSKDEKLF